jgi:Ca2+-transporting ATPase
MVLADDNFATIVDAVEEGRKIYDNIRKSIQFLLSSNLSEVISIFTATMIGFTLLRPVHLLWINLLTDTFPAVGLGLEEAEDDIMSRPPRDPKMGIFAGGVATDCLYQGVLVMLLTFASFGLGNVLSGGAFGFKDSPIGITMAFITMSMAEIFHSFNMRSARKSLLSIKKKNLYLLGAMLLSFVLTQLVLFVPFFRSAFGFEPVTLKMYLLAVGLGLLIIPLVEIVKLLQRASARVRARRNGEIKR